jgi:tetratricopeptide (TPR) repeat protein
MTRISACLLVLASSTASAQHARFPREQPVPEAPVFSDRVKPVEPHAVVAAQKPSLGMDDVLSIDSLKGAIRGEQEQILVQLIANTPDSEIEEKTDYYFRLGELYAKQQRMWRLQQSPAAANKAKEYLLKAVKTYKGLTDNAAFRTYPKMDMALFYYAYVLQGGKYMKEARAVYDKLLKNYPNSKFVPEAHLAFGDYYYDTGQLADAEARYKQVLRFPRSTAYAYAMYQLGWIDLSLQRPQDAIERFFQAVIATRNDAKQAALHAAARADFVRASSSVGTPAKAQDVFAKLDGPGGAALVELLAETARDAGDPERAVTVYRGLVARKPRDPRACAWQYELARTTLTLPTATPAIKLAAIEALVKAATSLKTPDAECSANAAAVSGEIAAARHAEWAATKNTATLLEAETLYALHAGAFPEDAAARDAYAEVLWTRADLEAAPKVRAQLWRRSAETFAATSTLENTRAAALAWMNALDIELPTTVVLGKAPRSRPHAKPLDATSARAVAAVAAYIKLGAEADPELAAMRLAVATILRRHRHYDEAVTALDQLLAHHPDDARAEVAANLLLDSMIQGKRTGDLRDVVEAIAADTDFVEGKPELKKNLLVLRSLR